VNIRFVFLLSDEKKEGWKRDRESGNMRKEVGVCISYGGTGRGRTGVGKNSRNKEYFK
jgi:hypothetical protein